MKKRFKVILIIIALFFSFKILFSVEEKPLSIQAVLSEIRLDEGLKKNENINTGKVSPARLEELGDSVMEALIGNHDLHELLDKKWGGEGSPALKEMHQRIGYHYLAGYPMGMLGWMTGYPENNNNETNQIFSQNRFRGGYPMMWGNWNGNWPGMMGWWGFGGAFMGLLFFILLIVIIVFVIRAARGGAYRGLGETPLDILKKRYAKGEITKEEFERIKKDITG